MLIRMKTTMNLPDALFIAVKQRANAEHRSVTSVVEEALRSLLAERPSAAKSIHLPSWGAGSSDGYLVDLEDRDALWAALDESA